MAEDRDRERKPHADGTVPLTPPGAGRGRGTQDRLLGQVIDGRFRLRAVLGEGGMGRVYLAEDEKLNRRRVALKLMGSALTNDKEFRDRFDREAALQANLPHPQIVQIIDTGECAEGAYIVMEYSNGQCLSTLLRELGPRPLDRALEITEQLLEILDFAHRQDVVHRDLKPGNILIEERAGREFVRVLDFGIAKLMTRDGGVEHAMTLTKAGHTYGTLGYMAPEQAKGEIEKLDHRADIYALGVILYEMLTGRVPAPPEARTHPVRYAMWVASNPVRPLRETHPELDFADDVDSIIRGALRRDPEKRYPSALAFLNAIRQFRRSAEASTVKRAPIVGNDDSDPRTGARVDRGRSSTPAKPPVPAASGSGAAGKIGWILAVAFLAAGGFGWWKWWNDGNKPGPGPGPAVKDEKLVAEAADARSALTSAGIESTSLGEGIRKLAEKAAKPPPPDAATAGKLQDALGRITTLESEKRSAEAEAKSQSAAATQAAAAEKAAREEKEKVAGDLTRAQGEIKRLQADLVKKSGELDAITDQATNLRREIEGLRQKGGSETDAEVRRKLESETKRADDLQVRLRAQETESGSLRSRAEAAEGDRDQARREIVEKNRRIGELESAGGQANSGALARAEIERDQARQALASEQERARRLDQDATNLRVEVDRLRRQGTATPPGPGPGPGPAATGNYKLRNGTKDNLKLISIVVTASNGQQTRLDAQSLGEIRTGSEIQLPSIPSGTIEINFKRVNNRGTPIQSFDTERTLSVPTGGGVIEIKD